MVATPHSDSVSAQSSVRLADTESLSVTDNPGAWFLHWCVLDSQISIVALTRLFSLSHIDWHLEAGLAVVFAEAPEDNVEGPASQITPQDWKDLCPEFDDLAPTDQ